MKLRAINDKLVVEPIEIKEEMDTGGIIIPNEESNIIKYGKVISMEFEDYNIQVGDTILFTKHVGIPVLLQNGKKLIILTKSDALAILDPSDELSE